MQSIFQVLADKLQNNLGENLASPVYRGDPIFIPVSNMPALILRPMASNPGSTDDINDVENNIFEIVCVVPYMNLIDPDEHYKETGLDDIIDMIQGEFSASDESITAVNKEGMYRNDTIMGILSPQNLIDDNGVDVATRVGTATISYREGGILGGVARQDGLITREGVITVTYQRVVPNRYNV